MKKILILLSLLVPAIAFMSCSDDNDMPDVKIEVSFDNATMADGKLYVVQGQEFTVNSITVTNNESGKNAGITAANYFWDYIYAGTSVEPPYSFKLMIGENVPAGSHVFEIQGTVFAVDKTPAETVISNEVIVVEDASELPEATGPATITVNASVHKASK